MIRIDVKRDRIGFCGFSAEGHTGYAEHGKDIVCAAVSAILQTAALGVQHTNGVVADVRTDAASLVLELRKVPDGQSRAEIEAIIRAMALGLAQLQSQYTQFVRLNLIDTEEVSTC